MLLSMSDDINAWNLNLPAPKLNEFSFLHDIDHMISPFTKVASYTPI